MAKILVVDDDDLFRDMVDQTLRRLGHEVVTARDGRDALAVYNAETVNLVITDVITDVIMPDMEGIELIKELRQLNPKARIIAISGGGRNSPQSYLPIARAMGAIHTLAKPFQSEQLATAIQSALSSAA